MTLTNIWSYQYSTRRIFSIIWIECTWSDIYKVEVGLNYPIIDADHVVLHILYVTALQLEDDAGFVALTVLYSLLVFNGNN